jgi:hypothetical protein
MGFAQKLGQFAGGFSEGLLPGIQVGTDIAESKSRRAAASTRENRLAEGAERAMLWKMFELDPAGAMAKAESLGYSELATSFRRKTKGTIGAKYATAGAGMSEVPKISPLTDYTPKGMRDRANLLQGNVDTRTAAAGNVDITLAGVPEGLGGLVDSDPLLAQRRAFNTQTDVIRSTLTATEAYLSSVSSLNYNEEGYLNNIDEATNAYIQATGDTQSGEALKLELLKAARESQRSTWVPVINAMSDDAEGLKDLAAKRIIMDSPILSTMVASLMRKAETEKDLSPEQKRIRDEARNSAKVLEGLAKNTAITNPEAAADYYAQSLDILTENQLENPETLAILRNNAEYFLSSAMQRSRQEIATSIFSDITNSYLPPEVMLGKYGKLFNIDIPVGIKIDTEEGQRIFSNLIDAIQGATLQTQEPEVEGDADFTAILKLLNAGELDSANSSFRVFINDPAATSPEDITKNKMLIESLKLKGWEWRDFPMPGGFIRLDTSSAGANTPVTPGQTQEVAASNPAPNEPAPGVLPFMPQGKV